MKFRFLALLALVLGLASCQNDPEGINIDANGEAAVTLNVSLPEEATRAAGANSALGAIGNIDVENSFDIRYILEVYNPDGSLAKDRMTKIKDTETTAAFSFRLIPGRGYKFVVWADFVAEVANPDDATDLHYDTSAGLDEVKVKMANWTVIDESRDAYTGVADVANFSGASSVPEIKLTRPFAKLRVVTNDIKEMISVRPAEVKVNYFNTKFRDTFDAFAEQASGSVDAPANLTVKLIDATNPDTYTDETPETNGVQTLFADYFFGAEDDRVMFTLDVKDNGTTPQDLPQVTFNTNIPVKRNYLTTVYGPILTDSNNITVTIDSAFENGSEWNPEEDEYDIAVWDGQSTNEPAYDPATKTYTIKNGNELAWLADQVNGVTRAASNTFSGYNFVLAKDINLGDNEWTPIGGSGKHFAGTFDGKNYTVSNFQVTKQEGYAALFGNARAHIKNLNVENVKIVSHHYAGAIVGQGYSKIEECNVDNIDITLTTKDGDLGDKAGGIIGQNCEGAGMYVKNSTAKNVTIKGYRDLGGIAGMAHNSNTVSGCSVENITIIQDLSVNYEDNTPTTLGAVIGRKGTNVIDENNTVGEGIEIAILAANSEQLQAALEAAGAAGAGDTTIVFAENTTLDMTNTEWTPIKVDGYHGADIVTIEGNGAVITGLKAPLFAGGFAGGSGIVIKDLTIKDSDIVSTNTLGSGAFIESIDSMDKIELTNCHLLDSTVTGGAGSRTGGLIGWTAGYNNQKDGPVKTFVTIDNCSVIGCTIQCDGSVGGINGHAGNNAWTYTTIKNCTIQNNILNSTDDGEWRTGVVVGTANVGEVTISNITESGNTLTQTGKTAPEGEKRNYYGRFVPGTTGKLIIDGEEIVMINTAEKLTDAIQNAKAGDTITIAGDITLTENVTIPAGVTFNGNGKQINGTLIAGGDIAFAGHTKVTAFSAGFSGYEITIGEGACLEITGGGRSTMGYNNTFNITGTITDAKNADKANIQPSLIMPAGISITGGNGLELNIKDAYVQLGSTTSKNSAANGTFTINIENSIAEFTNQLTFSEPTSGMNPTFNLNVKNSVLTTATKLILTAKNCNMVVDNSTIDVKTYFRNSGNVELKNGSVLTGNTIQFGENGGHDGTTTVDASKFTIKASSTGHAYDGKGTGSITLKNDAEASVDYYKDLTINCDASSTFTGTKVL